MSTPPPIAIAPTSSTTASEAGRRPIRRITRNSTAVTTNQVGSTMSGRTATGMPSSVSSGAAISAGVLMPEIAMSANSAAPIIVSDSSSTMPGSGCAGMRCSWIDSHPALITALRGSAESNVGNRPRNAFSPANAAVMPRMEAPIATSGGIQRCRRKMRVIVLARNTSRAKAPPTSHHTMSCSTTCRPA